MLSALLERYPDRLATPSVSYGTSNLYMRGVFEEETRANLSRPMTDLMVRSPQDSCHLLYPCVVSTVPATLAAAPQYCPSRYPIGCTLWL